MKYDDNARIEQSDVEDIRGAGPARGGRMAGGGGAALKLGGGGAVVAIIVALASQLFGVNLGGLFGGGGGGGSPASSNVAANNGQPAPPIDPAKDPHKDLKKFVQLTITDIQDTFTKLFQERGQQYPRAKLVIFTEAVDTACGLAGADVGPFYCPGDQKAYIDFSFYQVMSKRLGAPGDFAQAYVLAHEIGHHLQTVLRVDEIAARRRDKTKNELSVMQELQADCYAGVWGHSARKRGLLEIGDLEEAINAAQAIGDDRLAKNAGVNPNAESFTHGSSAQRMKWVKVGLESGKLESCDTFSPGVNL